MRLAGQDESAGNLGLVQGEIALEFREIREEQAVYYLADFAFISGEAIYLDLAIRPEGQPGALSLQFNQTLYAD